MSTETKPRMLLTVKEVAAELRLDRSDVYRLVRDGRLRGKHQIVRGRGLQPRIVITRADLEAYVRSLPDAADRPKRRTPRPSSRLPKELREELAAAKEYV